MRIGQHPSEIGPLRQNSSKKRGWPKICPGVFAVYEASARIEGGLPKVWPRVFWATVAEIWVEGVAQSVAQILCPRIYSVLHGVSSVLAQLDQLCWSWPTIIKSCGTDLGTLAFCVAFGQV